LPESAAVIETILEYCYSTRKEPEHPEGPQGRQISHWAEVSIAADKYRFHDDWYDDLDTYASFQYWSARGLAKCIERAEERLVRKHDGSSDPTASAELQALWKDTDFEDLVLAVDMLLESTITERDGDVSECLTMIDWGKFAVGDYQAAWLDLIERYPSYVANVVQMRSCGHWVWHCINKDQQIREFIERPAATT